MQSQVFALLKRHDLGRFIALSFVIVAISAPVRLAVAQNEDTEVARSALVIPLDSELSPELADVVLAFNLALAELSGHSGAQVTVAQTNLPDTMAAVGCVEKSAACLAKLAVALDVDRIVYGTLQASSDPYIYQVELVVARGNADYPLTTHRFLVRVQDAAQAEDAFVSAAPNELLDQPATVTDGSGTDGTQDRLTGDVGDSATQAPPHHVGSYRYDLDRVERGSWLLAGSGAAAIGMGTVFWLIARSSQNDVDRFRVETPPDLARLRSLEDRTQTRATIGNVLVITGLVAVAAGAVLGFRQARVAVPAADTDSFIVTVAPLTHRDGAGAALMLRWLY